MGTERLLTPKNTRSSGWVVCVEMRGGGRNENANPRQTVKLPTPFKELLDLNIYETRTISLEETLDFYVTVRQRVAFDSEVIIVTQIARCSNWTLQLVTYYITLTQYI